MKTKILLYITYPILLSLVIFTSHAQQTLTLSDAIQIGIENNYDIQLYRNYKKISEENHTIGNAGMLPSINAVTTLNNTVLHTEQTQSTGNIIEVDGAKNQAFNYGLALNWTIFDGFKMFSKNAHLNSLNEIAKQELMEQIVIKISDIQSKYFEIASLEAQQKALDSLLIISENRLEIASNRYEIGKAARLEVLNANVDLNADKSILIQIDQQIKLAKVDLNVLLARQPDYNFEVVTNLTSAPLIQFDDIQSKMKSNPTIVKFIWRKKAQEYNTKQVRANRLPIVQLNSGYTFVNSKSPYSFVTESNGRNFTYGFSASIPIFNGFNQNRLEKIAKLEEEAIAVEEQKQQLNMQAELTKAFENYLTALQLLEIEESNFSIAKRNFEITFDKYRIGTLAPVEFRTAQNNLSNSQLRYIQAQTLVKLSEVYLQELSGEVPLD